MRSHVHHYIAAGRAGRPKDGHRPPRSGRDYMTMPTLGALVPGHQLLGGSGRPTVQVAGYRPSSRIDNQPQNRGRPLDLQSFPPLGRCERGLPRHPGSDLKLTGPGGRPPAGGDVPPSGCRVPRCHHPFRLPRGNIMNEAYSCGNGQTAFIGMGKRQGIDDGYAVAHPAGEDGARSTRLPPVTAPRGGPDRLTREGRGHPVSTALDLSSSLPSPGGSLHGAVV